MPRYLRVEYPGAIYHLMSRGGWREAIFHGGSDRRLFLDTGVAGKTTLPNQSDYDGRPHVDANRFSARHDGRGNIAFIDGHIESLRADKVVRPDGKAFFPPQEPVQWTCDPAMNPNG